MSMIMCTGCDKYIDSDWVSCYESPDEPLGMICEPCLAAWEEENEMQEWEAAYDLAAEEAKALLAKEAKALLVEAVKDEGLEALASDMIRNAVLRAEQGQKALELVREFVAEIEDNLTDGEINEDVAAIAAEFLPSYVVPTYRKAKALLEGKNEQAV